MDNPYMTREEYDALMEAYSLGYLSSGSLRKNLGVGSYVYEYNLAFNRVEQVWTISSNGLFMRLPSWMVVA